MPKRPAALNPRTLKGSSNGRTLAWHLQGRSIRFRVALAWLDLFFTTGGRLRCAPADELHQRRGASGQAGLRQTDLLQT